MVRIKLLGTDPCHLCDKAQQELSSYQIFSKLPFEYDYFDIVDRDDWYEAYQHKIPVLLDEKSSKLLLYPFEFNDVMRFLESISELE